MMTHRPIRTLLLLACALLLSWDIAPAMARVTIRGQVQYWDQIRGAYFPVQRAFVEIEGDWAMFDPERQTDSDGRYSVTVRDPVWGDFDGVDIEVYASTPGEVQVFASITGVYTYHAISRERDGVSAGSTATINLKIGGPENNVGDAWPRTVAETANAFVVHQTIEEVRRTMRAKRFPNAAFDEVEVIVPAASPAETSYTNPITGFINLVLDSAGWSGLGSWAELPRDRSSYGDVNRFVQMVRHEYTHSFHEAMTGESLPAGLISPSRHNLEMESDIYIAFTEGFAAFFPYAIANVTRNRLEKSRSLPGGRGYDRALNTPREGYRAAMEGEIAALFWDIFDGVGDEPVRYPATRSHDGRIDVPGAIVSAQTFRDRLSDPNMTKMIDVMRIYTLGFYSDSRHPVETIHEFLDEYKRRYPGDANALKVIAYNRGITFLGAAANRPARVKGRLDVSRVGRTVRLAFTVEELDADDRPNVGFTLWSADSGGDVRRMASETLAAGWRSAERRVEGSYALPAGIGGASDKLWLVVTDDMRPVAYRLDIPRHKPRDKLFGIKIPFDKIPDLVLDPTKRPRLAKDTRVFLDADGKTTRTVTQDLKNLREQIVAFRAAFREARRELREAALRERAAVKHERRLFRFAIKAGEIASPVKPREVFTWPPPKNRVATVDAVAAKNLFERWLDRGPSARAFQGKFGADDKRWLAGQADDAARKATFEQTARERVDRAVARVRVAAGPLTGNQAPPWIASLVGGELSKLTSAAGAALPRATVVNRLNRAASALRALGRE